MDEHTILAQWAAWEVCEAPDYRRLATSDDDERMTTQYELLRMAEQWHGTDRERRRWWYVLAPVDNAAEVEQLFGRLPHVEWWSRIDTEACVGPAKRMIASIAPETAWPCIACDAPTIMRPPYSYPICDACQACQH